LVRHVGTVGHSKEGQPRHGPHRRGDRHRPTGGGAFDVVGDERNEPRFNPRMRRAEKISGGAIGVGTRFRAEVVSMGRPVEMVIVGSSSGWSRSCGRKDPTSPAARSGGSARNPSGCRPRSSRGSVSLGPRTTTHTSPRGSVLTTSRWLCTCRWTTARVRSVQLDRWADPERSGAFAWHPFGIEVDGYATLDGVSIPNRGRGGWFFGTDRWPEGDFFHYEITDLSLQESRRREP
jgi:hypothetical protein